VKLGGEPLDCKVSGKDTGGAMAIFEFTAGWPRHLHHEQDEWIYVLEGNCHFEVGGEQMRLSAGESIFIPRKTSHVWTGVGGTPVRILNVYQPAGTMEEFFRALSAAQEQLPSKEDVLQNSYIKDQETALRQLFDAHGMDLLGPPLVMG
jgi:quercetin 2,3-dioxygenase